MARRPPKRADEVTDTLLGAGDRKEALSRVYARAVAAAAGYAVGECDFDRDGVDLRIHAGGKMRPALDLQLKATVKLPDPVGGYRRFPLKRRNYDLLSEGVQTPRLLVVVDLPQNEAEWITIAEDGLTIRRRAYWLNLRDSPATDNTSSVTVEIPVGNRFNVATLRWLMDQSRRGRIQ